MPLLPDPSGIPKTEHAGTSPAIAPRMTTGRVASLRRVCRCGIAFRPLPALPPAARRFCSRACYFASMKVPLATVFLRDRGRCHLCGERVRWLDASRDHVVPRSRGGATTWQNIRLAHRACNSVRGDLPLGGPGAHLPSPAAGTGAGSSAACRCANRRFWHAECAFDGRHGGGLAPMTRRTRTATARTIASARSLAAGGGLPSSARRDLPASTDEDASLPLPGEEFIQLADGDDWPAHLGAARLGIP